jgi:hypothetical protein
MKINKVPNLDSTKQDMRNWLQKEFHLAMLKLTLYELMNFLSQWMRQWKVQAGYTPVWLPPYHPKMERNWGKVRKITCVQKCITQFRIGEVQTNLQGCRDRRVAPIVCTCKRN